MKIRITRGIYGYQEKGNIVEKTKADPAFDVDEDEGKRLISLKVAEAVSSEHENAVLVDEEKDTVSGETSKEGHISRETLESMKKEELGRLAEELGIKKSGSREDIMERIMQCPVYVDDEEALDDAEMPELTAEDPE